MRVLDFIISISSKQETTRRQRFQINEPCSRYERQSLFSILKTRFPMNRRRLRVKIFLFSLSFSFSKRTIYWLSKMTTGENIIKPKAVLISFDRFSETALIFSTEFPD